MAIAKILADFNLVVQYGIVCNPGFTGKNCEVDMDVCEALSVKCGGHGRCVDDINGYYCVCNPGFSGATCSEGMQCMYVFHFVFTTMY